MNKLERVEQTLSGKEVDRPPVSFWYHFGVQHEGGKRIAELSLSFLRFYDLDWLKLMNDYYYPMPEGVLEIADKEGLKKITPLEPEATPWNEQLKAIDILSRALKDEAYIIDTVFDPYQVLLRNLAGEHLATLLKEEPEAVLEALEVITDNVIAYSKEAIRRGCAGIFISTFGAEKQMPREQYLTFARPFVERILKETKDLAFMNTLHVHDYGIYTDDVVDLPAHIISYEDRDPSNPSMAEMKKKFPGTVMAGLDKHRMTRVTPADAIRNAKEGMELGGSSRFLLAPGCSFPTWLYPESAKGMVEYVKASAKG
jgi:uroporphyrinogen decarboxylase